MTPKSPTAQSGPSASLEDRCKALIHSWYERNRLDESDAQWMREKTYEQCADELTTVLLAAPPAGARDAVADAAVAWQEGYRSGVEDERTSDENIGIAGFGAKIEPARANPYTQPAATGAGDGLERFLIQNLLKYMTIVDDRNDVWSHWQGVRVSVKQLATEYLGDTK